MKKIVLLLMTSLIASSIYAVNLSQLHLVASDGTYLGNFKSKYDSKSIYNEYGSHGSPYSSNSIMNSYGIYGSEYSSKSPFNKYSDDGPLLYDNEGNYYGKVSLNKYANGVTYQTYNLAVQLYALQQSYN